MYNIRWIKYDLNFKKPAGTSRGVLNFKSTYFLKIWRTESPEVFGLGECNLFRGLSYDDHPDYELVLENLRHFPNNYIQNLAHRLKEWPSIRFGLEMALLDLNNGGNQLLFDTDFTSGKKGIPINGLIWMDDVEQMKNQIREKIEEGFKCIKLKIGALDFENELELLKNIRKEFSGQVLELRVDANGAFSPEEALGKLDLLSKLDVHSIEQPIKQGQIESMARLCKNTPIPIALDEELIGLLEYEKKIEILEFIEPQYLILKPSLLGGFLASEEWINMAKARKIKWWVTSALESNIGLNAIAQWTQTLNTKMYQGLGTGKLFTNNPESPLQIEKAQLWHSPRIKWMLSQLKFEL